MKTIKQSEWKALPGYAPATATTATVRRDGQGRLWAWVRGGKRVTVKEAARA